MVSRSIRHTPQIYNTRARTRAILNRSHPIEKGVPTTYARSDDRANESIPSIKCNTRIKTRSPRILNRCSPIDKSRYTITAVRSTKVANKSPPNTRLKKARTCKLLNKSCRNAKTTITRQRKNVNGIVPRIESELNCGLAKSNNTVLKITPSIPHGNATRTTSSQCLKPTMPRRSRTVALTRCPVPLCGPSARTRARCRLIKSEVNTQLTPPIQTQIKNNATSTMKGFKPEATCRTRAGNAKSNKCWNAISTRSIKTKNAPVMTIRRKTPIIRIDKKLMSKPKVFLSENYVKTRSRVVRNTPIMSPTITKIYRKKSPTLNKYPKKPHTTRTRKVCPIINTRLSLVSKPTSKEYRIKMIKAVEDASRTGPRGKTISKIDKTKNAENYAIIRDKLPILREKSKRNPSNRFLKADCIKQEKFSVTKSHSKNISKPQSNVKELPLPPILEHVKNEPIENRNISKRGKLFRRLKYCCPYNLRRHKNGSKVVTKDVKVLSFGDYFKKRVNNKITISNQSENDDDVVIIEDINKNAKIKAIKHHKNEASSRGSIDILNEIPNKCPITQKPMKQPMKNIFCGHYIDKIGLQNYLEQRKENARCPHIMCTNRRVIKMSHYQIDRTIYRGNNYVINQCIN